MWLQPLYLWVFLYDALVIYSVKAGQRLRTRAEMSRVTVSLWYRMTWCRCGAVSLLMWCDDAFSGCGLSWQIIKRHLLKQFVLAGTNSKECPLLSRWKASSPQPHLLLTPDLTGQPNSRKKAVNVKGICEGHSPARTPEHHACRCLHSLPQSRRFESGGIRV